MGRPRHGKQVKIHKSVKLEPRLIKYVLKKYETFSGGVENLIKEDMEGK